jgi:hypothetical protein
VSLSLQARCARARPRTPRAHPAASPPPLPGTSLGDPVEVNAAAGALLAPSGGASAAARAPLALLASKTWHGHAEPAAGLVALAHASSAAAASARHPLLHLRALNPHVAGALEALSAPGGGGGGGGRVAAARQAAPLPVGGREAAVVSGTSSFAFMVRRAACFLAGCH